MVDNAFKPVFYLKENCPFCLKIRIFILEAGLTSDVEISSFESGSAQEALVRKELEPYFDKITFPVAQLEPGRHIAESDEIIAGLATRAGCVPEEMDVYRNYIDGTFALAMKLWKENAELKKGAT